MCGGHSLHVLRVLFEYFGQHEVSVEVSHDSLFVALPLVPALPVCLPLTVPLFPPAPPVPSLWSFLLAPAIFMSCFGRLDKGGGLGRVDEGKCVLVMTVSQRPSCGRLAGRLAAEHSKLRVELCDCEAVCRPSCARLQRCSLLFAAQRVATLV